MPRGVLGLNAPMFRAICATSPTAAPRKLACRCTPKRSTLPMDERDDRPQKERNFFETRVIEYQSGGALS